MVTLSLYKTVFLFPHCIWGWFKNLKIFLTIFLVISSNLEQLWFFIWLWFFWSKFDELHVYWNLKFWALKVFQIDQSGKRICLWSFALTCNCAKTDLKTTCRVAGPASSRWGSQETSMPVPASLTPAAPFGLLPIPVYQSPIYVNVYLSGSLLTVK